MSLLLRNASKEVKHEQMAQTLGKNLAMALQNRS